MLPYVSVWSITRGCCIILPLSVRSLVVSMRLTRGWCIILPLSVRSFVVSMRFNSRLVYHFTSKCAFFSCVHAFNSRLVYHILSKKRNLVQLISTYSWDEMSAYTFVSLGVTHWTNLTEPRQYFRQVCNGMKHIIKLNHMASIGNADKSHTIIVCTFITVFNKQSPALSPWFNCCQTTFCIDIRKTDWYLLK